MDREKYFKELIENEDQTKQRLFYSAVYLFSQKGYDNVGIRELCRSVGIKESSFYNHYSGKKSLFLFILEAFSEVMEKTVFTDEEIIEAAKGDIKSFLLANMEKFSSHTDDPLFRTMLQIVLMECYTYEEAYELAQRHIYHLRKDYTEAVLEKMKASGKIIDCDVSLITAEYYYTLKGLLDEYVLRDVWDDDLTPVNQKIIDHIDFFARMLTKEIKK